MKSIYIILLTSVYLTAQQKGASPIITTASQATTNNTYAVVVGISNYQNEGIPDLRFADKDAEAFAGFLQSPAGGSLDEDHLKVLINEKATQAQFASALDWLWEVVKENDRVIIYFSGHGDVEKKSLTQPGYLLCWDAPSHVYMAGGAFNVRDLNDVVSTLSIQNKGKVILFTDACRAGKLSGSEIGGAQATASNMAKQFSSEVKILSCQPDEFSIEGEQWGGGRGAFSYHLLDGLYGMADVNLDKKVNLLEIGRYLEDKVTTEVSPLSQIPMTIGSKNEILTDVFPDILSKIKESKTSQMPMFLPTDTRGLEEVVLSKADSNIVKMYLLFKQTLANKLFLEPANNCADFYYEKLSKEPQMAKLHSSMKRNYVAALQDEAQQVMNTMLKSGLTAEILKNNDPKELYKDYPEYLHKAANILGENHYMFKTLQARKNFFEGFLQNTNSEKRNAYKQALSLQNDMAHAMVYLVRNFEANQQDSAEYFFRMAAEQVPSWVEPYLAMSAFYKEKLKQLDKAEEMLKLAEKIDSNSILVWYQKAVLYSKQKKYELAEKYYLKTIAGVGDDICFPCTHHNLGIVYMNTRQFEKAINSFHTAISLDSINSPVVKSFCKPCANINLGIIYRDMGQYETGEKYFLKSIAQDSTRASAYDNLGLLYKKIKQNDKAEAAHKKAIALDPLIHTYNNLGLVYSESKRYVEAEEVYKKVIQLDSNYFGGLYNLGTLYFFTKRYEEAEKTLKKVIEINANFKLVYVSLGSVYIETQRYEDAQNFLKKAIELDSTQSNPYYYLAVAQSLQNQTDAAFENLEKYIQLDNNFYDALQEEKSLATLRALPAWDVLMKKYFPDKFKK